MLRDTSTTQAFSPDVFLNDTRVTRMQVIDRHGASQPVDPLRIISVIQAACEGLEGVDPMQIAVRTISGLHDGVTTRALNDLSVQIAHQLTGEDPDYSLVAARLRLRMTRRDLVDQGIHNFAQSIEQSYKAGQESEVPLIDPKVRAFVKQHAAELNALIDPLGDDRFEYMGVQTLLDRYVTKHPKTRLPMETMQYFLLRVAVGTANTMEDVREVYDMYSTLRYLSATPTLMNSGTPRAQCSSCFVPDSPQDSLESIYKRLEEVAFLSKFSGGIGMSYTRVRAKGSLIRGTNGHSDGVIPWLRTLGASVAAVNQGGNRKGACAIYLEPWHADVEAFMELRDNTGDHTRRAHELNLAFWVPDLFMERVQNGGDWSLFCPSDFPNLADLHGDAFKAAYEAAEQSGKARKTLKASALYTRMMRTLTSTGNGWMCFKDRMNGTSNQTLLSKNVIHSSNLCVAPDTLLLTYEQGERPISELAGQSLHVWNGQQWSLAAIAQTGTDVSLTRVALRLERNVNPLLSMAADLPVKYVSLHCTPYHKFFQPDGTRIETKDLQVDQSLMTFSDNHGVSYTVKVTEIIPDDLVADTYCVNEPREHAAMFNGVLTGQCTEIAIVNSDDEVSVCNLASINLGKHLTSNGIDFKALQETVRVAVRQLNRVIDKNFYTIKKTKASNFKWRPVGLGLMGFQDALFALKIPFDSERAQQISTDVLACMYYTALQTSMELAQDPQYGKCTAFEETRLSQGVFSFELHGVKAPEAPQDSGITYDWETLRANIMQHGTANSLLLAIAPTATIASIAGCYECIEPQVKTHVRRETMSGDFTLVNRSLVNELKSRGLWTKEVRDEITRADGSIQSVESIPEDVRHLYRTAWELPQKVLIDMAAARTPFIDQSQSLNLFVKDPKLGKVSSMYMYAWKKGLKTTYYLRSQNATKGVKASVSSVKGDQKQADKAKTYTDEEALVCSLENPESCEACQ